MTEPDFAQTGPSTPPVWLQRAAYALLPLVLVWTGLTARLAWDAQWSGPFRDLWEFMPFLDAARQGAASWQDWWAAYGGAHRIVLPRLLFLLDYGWLGGHNRTMLLTAWLCQLGIAGLLWQTVRRHAGPTVALLGVMLSLFCLFSPTQLFNFNYSFDVQWFLATFGVCASLVLALKLQARPGIGHCLALLIIAGLTSLTNFAGLLVWPALILLSLLLPFPWRYRGVIAATAAVMVPVYLHHMMPDNPAMEAAMQQGLAQSDASTIALMLLSRLYHLVLFVGRYLGSPLSRDWPLMGTTLSGLTLIWVAWQGWRLRRLPDPRQPIHALFITLALYVTLVGLATGWGRAIYPNQAVAERFQTMVLLYWLTLGHLALLRYADHRRPWPLLGVTMLTAVLVPYAIGSAQQHLRLGSAVQQAHTGIRLGLTDMAVSKWTLSYPAIRNQHNYVARHASFMRDRQWPPFQATPGLGQTLVFPDGQHHPGCSVAIHRSETLTQPSHRQFRGSWQCPSAHTVVVTDTAGTILGLGQLPLWPAWQFPERPRYPWSGYSAVATPDNLLWRAVLLDRAGQPLAASRLWSP